ncbi:metallophosphoesterase [Desulfopila sp. IMCC35008]|uniref:metallophosphoesterase n=1 Tax=Desulfopila sp. IMCC35008 TaxID=2653858 RepID=UPI0013D29DF9|nr:metallophosphoesterase [Desulfopila sp. IMCC35008]
MRNMSLIAGHNGADMNRRHFLRSSFAVGACLLTSYPVLIERNLLRINQYRIPVTNLPVSFHDFKIVQITDLHYGPLVSLDFVAEVVQKANNLAGDIIVCTGDYVHGNKEVDHVDAVWPLLGELAAPYGVWSVLGNHDHWADLGRSNYWLQKTGQDLRHKCRKIEKGDDAIWLGGAGDYLEDRLGVDELFYNVPDDGCRILLSHNPDSADEPFRTSVDLIISGHTHGGQVVFPIIGAPVLPVRNKKYASGFVQTEKCGLFISKGIGWSILPVRVNCFPEIAVLRLVRRGSAPT